MGRSWTRGAKITRHVAGPYNSQLLSPWKNESAAGWWAAGTLWRQRLYDNGTGEYSPVTDFLSDDDSSLDFHDSHLFQGLVL